MLSHFRFLVTLHGVVFKKRSLPRRQAYAAAQRSPALAAFKCTFESHGVEFIDENGGGLAPQASADKTTRLGAGLLISVKRRTSFFSKKTMPVGGGRAIVL